VTIITRRTKRRQLVTLEITGAGPPLTVSQNPASRRIGQPDVVEITANGEDDDGAMKSVSLAGDYSATCVGDSSGLAQTKTGDLYAENPAGTPSPGRTSHAMAVKLSVDIARLSTCSAGYSFRALRGAVTAPSSPTQPRFSRAVLVVAAYPHLIALVAALRHPVEDRVVAHQKLGAASVAGVAAVNAVAVARERADAVSLG
jgi:hypothetical protein